MVAEFFRKLAVKWKNERLALRLCQVYRPIQEGETADDIYECKGYRELKVNQENGRPQKITLGEGNAIYIKSTKDRFMFAA